MKDLDALLGRARTLTARSAALRNLFDHCDAQRYLSHRRFEVWRQQARAELPQTFVGWVTGFFGRDRPVIFTLLRMYWRRVPLRPALNERIVEAVLTRRKELFDRVESQPLTQRQREACACDEDATLVVAGAGTGKTSTLVAKIGLLLETGQCRPEEILAISFTRKSAIELAERLEKRLKVDIDVATFHKLGSGILAKTRGKKPSLAPFSDSKPEKTKFIASLIKTCSERDDFKRDLVDFLVYHRVRVRQQWDFKSQNDYQEWIRSNRIVSLDGKPKKSLEECVIANWLIMMGVPFEYERPYEIDTATESHRQYQPDFYLPTRQIYVEHFGVNAQGQTAPYIDTLKYQEGMRWKREIHAQHKTRLIETYSWQHANGTLIPTLRAQLEAQGCVFAPKSIESVLDSLNKAGVVDQFCELLCQFLTLYKGNGNRLTDRPANESANDRERADRFLAVFRSVHAAYEEHNAARGDIDFEDMISGAAEAVRQGHYRSPYRYILIDEFQDISPGRADLVRALQQSHTDCAVYAVGDDWQSIYRFAGSDIGAMTRFGAVFGPSARVVLDRTFRFDDRIAALSSQFVMKNSVQIAKDLLPLRRSPTPSVVLYLRPRSADPRLWSLEQIERLASAEATVLILERFRRDLPDEASLRALRTRFPRLSIQAMTMHAAKGLEADYTVIGLRGGTWGFPSQRTDDALLDLVLTQADAFPFGEERRLFYVAVTRARRKAYLVADSGEDISLFTQELMAEHTEHLEIAGDRRFLPCPRCRAGTMRLGDGVRGRILECSNRTDCTHWVVPCSACGNGLLEPTSKSLFRCDTCRATPERCPRCGTGVLVQRQGPYGAFLGCSHYGAPGVECRYIRRS
jgi:DNA helicase-4